MANDKHINTSSNPVVSGNMPNSRPTKTSKQAKKVLLIVSSLLVLTIVAGFGVYLLLGGNNKSSQESGLQSAGSLTPEQKASQKAYEDQTDRVPKNIDTNETSTNNTSSTGTSTVYSEPPSDVKLPKPPATASATQGPTQ